MRRLLYLIVFVLILTACGSAPPKKSTIPVNPSPYPTAELLIAPPAMATSTPWLSPMSATMKAEIEARQQWTQGPSTPIPTLTFAIHYPTNIYSPTPGPREYLGSVSSSSGSSCLIKGNPDSMIYHCLNSPSYSTLKGAVYFCSPAEAEAAGYRAAKNMSGCQY